MKSKLIILLISALMLVGASVKWATSFPPCPPSPLVPDGSGGYSLPGSLAMSATSSVGGATVVGIGGSSTDNAIARYNGTAGNIQNSAVTVDDNGFISGSATQNTVTSSVYLTQSPTTLQDGSAYTGTDATQTTKYIAFKFTAGFTGTIGNVQIKIKESSDITNKDIWMTSYIYSDDGGSPSKPNARLNTGTDITFGHLTTSYQVLNWQINRAVTSGTAYWIVIYYATAPSGGSVVWDSDVSANMGATSDNGTDWTNTNVRLRYFIKSRTGKIFDAETHYGTAIYGSSYTGTGVQGSSQGYYGVRGLSTNFYGVMAESTYKDALRTQSYYGVPATNIATPDTTNDVVAINKNMRRTSGVASAGIGASDEFWIENSGGEDFLAARIAALLTTATQDGENSAIVFSTVSSGGAVTERVRVDTSGVSMPATNAMKWGSGASLFVSATDGKLYFTDPSGVDHALY